MLNLAGIRLPIDNVWVSSIVTATLGALLVILVDGVVVKPAMRRALPQLWSSLLSAPAPGGRQLGNFQRDLRRRQ